ncbi:hypothetical protein [Brevundimonas sp.]|nr:hypothetical protein [Brevundimonas sp.]
MTTTRTGMTTALAAIVMRMAMITGTAIPTGSADIIMARWIPATGATLSV